MLFSEKPKRELTKAELVEKKQKLKEKFDAEYDDNDVEKGNSYYDELKQETTKQTEVIAENPTDADNVPSHP